MTHRSLEFVCSTTLVEVLSRVPADQALVWTGRPYAAKEGSMRSNALGLVERPNEPVSLRELVSKAARFDGDRGYHPETVRDAIRSHQGAKPAAYILVRRTLAGAYLAVADVPFPAAGRRLRAGDTVFDPATGWVWDQPIGEGPRAVGRQLRREIPALP